MTQDEDQVTTETSETVDTMMEHSQDVGRRSPTNSGGGLEKLLGVSLTVSVQLGRTRMQVSDILNLGSGSVIELQKLASEPVEVLVNDAPFARGEVVVIEDHFAIKLTELLEDSEMAALGQARA
jgi:flagellar motor switch protein FliN/FliY